MGVRQRLFSQSAIIFAVRIGGAGVTFLAQAIIARLWGATVLGDYLIAIAAANLIAIILPLGFQTTGAYFAAEYAARDAGQSLRRFLMSAYGHIILPGLLVLIGMRFLLPLLGETGQFLTTLYLPVALLAVGTAIIYINGAVLVGLKRPYAGFFADTIFRPLLMVLAFVVVHIMLGAKDLGQMLWVLAAGYLVVATVHFALTVRAVRLVPQSLAMPKNEPQRWWYFALPWVAVSLAADFFFDLDLLALTGLLDSHQIAVFGVCTRIFVLASFGVAAVYAVAVPGLMEEEAASNAKGLAGKIADANLVAVGLSILLLIVVLMLSPFVLALFGPGFSDGVIPLGILCAALITRSIFGPASLILSARNRPYASLPAVGLGVVVVLLGNWLLVPPFGLTGAALSALFAFFVGAAGLWYTAVRLTGVDVSVFPALARFKR